MSGATIRFVPKISTALTRADVVAVVAPKAALDAGWHRAALGTDWAGSLDPVVEDLKPGDLGAVSGTYGPEKAPRRLIACALPDRVSRHNSPTRAESIRRCISQVPAGSGKRVAVVVHLDDSSHYVAASVAVARCFPHFTMASGGSSKPPRITVVAADGDGAPIKPPTDAARTADAVRLAARLVDTPPERMKTTDVEREAKAAAKDIAGVRVTTISGKRLRDKHMGGFLGVGSGATVPPRLVVLEYKPRTKPKKTVALVGKGIIYDTGGLNIKTGGHMANMKSDMGGAAAVLGAFLTLARGKVKDRIYALLCLAENAVGPESYRPDDILEMHSGKTVEVNNTDAEGRLVLADGVSYAARDLKADLIVDAATLTGAALITTGEIVSCLATNRDGLEAKAVAAGRLTGDLTHPILFAPEFFKQEFSSKVADMRNSVKSRMTAQSSCAGQFIYNHIEEFDLPWVHLDIAGPAFREGRGTGYGVALIAELVRNVTAEDLAK